MYHLFDKPGFTPRGGRGGGGRGGDRGGRGGGRGGFGGRGGGRGGGDRGGRGGGRGTPRGRGGARGGRGGRGGGRGGPKAVVVEPHRHNGKEDALDMEQPGSNVLYLGAASGLAFLMFLTLLDQMFGFGVLDLVSMIFRY